MGGKMISNRNIAVVLVSGALFFGYFLRTAEVLLPSKEDPFIISITPDPTPEGRGSEVFDLQERYSPPFEVDEVPDGDETPDDIIVQAAMEGDIERVRENLNGETTLEGRGRSLVEAAGQGYIEIVRLLIRVVDNDQYCRDAHAEATQELGHITDNDQRDRYEEICTLLSDALS